MSAAAFLQAIAGRKWPSGALVGLAPAFVRGAQATGDGTDTRLTISSASCDLIVVVACQQDGISAMVPISNRGGTFTQRATFTGTDGTYTNRTTVWTLEGFTSNASHLINVQNAVFGTMAVYCLNKGSANPILVDQTSTAVARTSAPYVTNSITPTRTASLAIASLSSINYSGDGATMGASAPFGNVYGSANGSYWTCVGAIATLAGTSAVTATFTNTGAPSNDATAHLMNLYYAP